MFAAGDGFLSSQDGADAAGNSCLTRVRTCSKRQIGKILRGQNGGSKIPSHSLQYEDLGSMIKQNQKLKSKHCRPVESHVGKSVEAYRALNSQRNRFAKVHHASD